MNRTFIRLFLFLAVTVVGLLSVASSSLATSSSPSSKQTMVWLCLERCGESAVDIQNNLDTIRSVAPRALTAVSFEMYDIGSNSTLVRNPRFTHMFPLLKQMKGAFGKPLRLLPMITTVKIDWMRELWANPEPFIDQCLSEARKYGFTGYNIDWEPEKGVVASDAPLYASFLRKMVTAMFDNGFELNVDIASWTVLYNFTALSEAMSVGPLENRVITMDTYAGSQTGWEKAFNKALTSVTDIRRLGIGLDVENPNNGKPLTLDELSWRFDHIQKMDIQEVDFWMMNSTIMGEDTYWWHLMQAFLNN